MRYYGIKLRDVGKEKIINEDVFVIKHSFLISPTNSETSLIWDGGST